MNFIEFFQTLESWGLTDALLPFLLIFVIIFAILQRTKLLGEGKKNFNLVIALVIALGVVIPHLTRSYPPGADVVEIINSALPQVSLLIVAILMLLIMLGVFLKDVNVAGTSLGGVMTIVSIIAIIYIFGTSAGWFGRWPSWLNFMADPNTQALVILILVFGIIIHFITSEPKEKKPGEGVGEFLKGLSKLGGK